MFCDSEHVAVYYVTSVCSIQPVISAEIVAVSSNVLRRRSSFFSLQIMLRNSDDGSTLLGGVSYSWSVKKVV